MCKTVYDFHGVIDYPQDCPPQDCPLGGNLEVGNPESISHQDCPPQLLCFFMNCLYLIWTWVNAGLNASVFKSLYFEEQSDSCDFRSHLKMHSGNATNVTMHDLGQAIWELVWKHTVKKTKQMQTVWFYNQSGRRFEETFENIQWRKVKQM